MSNDTRVRLIAEIDATSKGLVDALKQASSAVNSTTGDWKSQFASLKDATTSIGTSVKNLSDLVGQVGKIDMDVSGLDTIGNAISTVRGNFDAVKAEVDAFAQSLSVLKSEAHSLGMPVEEYQRFAEAVKASGVSMSDAQQMVRTMQEQIQHLADGVPEAQDLFSKLGLTIEQLSSNTVSANFSALVNAINDVVPASERASDNMRLFKASIDDTLKVVDQYNKATSRQAGGYASDKDVQNAISLASSLEKMADKLNGVTTSTERATNAQKELSSWEEIEVNNIEKSMEAQSRYNQSLDSMIAELAGVKNAFDVLFNSLDNTSVFDMSKIIAGDLSTPEIITRIIDLLDDEAKKIAHIISIQSELGAPIDTKPLETYISHIESLKQSYLGMIEMMNKKQGTFVSNNIDLDSFENLESAIRGVESNVDELNDKISIASDTLKIFQNQNVRLEIETNFEKAKDDLSRFKDTLDDAVKNLSNGKALSIDTSVLEKVKGDVENMASLISRTNFEFDTSSLESISRIAGVIEQEFQVLNDTSMTFVESIHGIPTEEVNAIANKFSAVIQELEELQDVETRPKDLDELNNVLDLSDERLKSIKDRLQVIGQRHKVNIDTKMIDDALRKIDRIRQTALKPKFDASGVTAMRDEIHNAEKELRRMNEETKRGVPLWRPLIDGARNLGTTISGVARHPFTAMWNGMKRVGNAISDATVRMTHFRRATENAKNSGDSIGNTLKQATLQMVGMGSAVGAVVMAMRKLVDLAKEYAKTLAEERADEMFRNSFSGMQGISSKRSEQETRFSEIMGMFKELVSLDDDSKKGNVEAKMKRINIEERLKNLYGIEFKSSGSEIVDLDKQIAEKINELKMQTLTSIEGNINSASEVINRTKEYIKSMTYGNRVITPGANALIKEASDTNTKATEERIMLQQSKWRMKHTDYAGEFLRERRGKSVQEQNEADRKAGEEARKAKEEQVKTLKEANRRIEAWSNSFTDNDRQKALREIMEKYNDAVKAGVDVQEARNVATKAISDVLRKERDDEYKKNKELLDALNQRIEAYKSAYQKYLDAEKGLIEAKREYADTQRDLAREAKSERIQRRRERIAKRLSTFGFQLPENFDVNESATQRNRRRRRQRLDTGIGEKLSQWQEGRNVHWTKAERERLGEYKSLQRKDKQLEAVQKQMDAAGRTENAAERLASAADAVRQAALTFGDAKTELRNAQREMDKASKSPMRQSQSYSAKDILDMLLQGGIDRNDVKNPVNSVTFSYKPEERRLKADKSQMRSRQRGDIRYREAVKGLAEKSLKKGNGLKAPGLSGLQTRQINYSDSLSMIHRDLVEMARKTFRVK